MNKRFLTAALVMCALSGTSTAQDVRRIFTHPQIPAPEALDRLHLREAWHAFVPMDGKRDGMFSLQLVPAGKSYQILIQTRAGLAATMDAETGQILWTTLQGMTYRPAQSPVAYNSRSIFLVNNVELFSVDRSTGQLQWNLTLPQGVTAPPVADEEVLYLSPSILGVMALRLPPPPRSELPPGKREKEEPSSTLPPPTRDSLNYGLPPSFNQSFRGIGMAAVGPLTRASEATSELRGGPQLSQMVLFTLPVKPNLEFPPLVGRDRVIVLGRTGQITSIPRSNPQEVFRLQTRGPIPVPGAQFDEVGYLAGNENTLYAVSMNTGQVFWRFFTLGPINRQPVVQNEDIFVSQGWAGLSCVNRRTGEETWRNQEANYFLARNKSFVYARDFSGRLLILDRYRGTLLSRFEGTRDYVFPLTNEWTDRVYLAANNGLILCLRDRDYPQPIPMKSLEPPAQETNPPLKPPAKPPTNNQEEKGEKPAPPVRGGEGAKPTHPEQGSEGAKPVPPPENKPEDG